MVRDDRIEEALVADERLGSSQEEARRCSAEMAPGARENGSDRVTSARKTRKVARPDERWEPSVPTRAASLMVLPTVAQGHRRDQLVRRRMRLRPREGFAP
jgi:hypothetical protein